MSRETIKKEALQSTLKYVLEELDKRIAEKGDVGFASIHECSGVIDEEVSEMKEAVGNNDHIEFDKECADIAVAAIWSIASLRSGTLDW